MTWNRLPLLAAMAIATLDPAFGAGAAGKWTASFDTQIGVQDYTYDFQVDGAKLTGKAKSQFGDTTITEGAVAGDEIAFVENVDFQGNAIRLEYKGKVSGDEIHFTRKVADFATEEFVAKRVKGDAPAATAAAADISGDWKASADGPNGPMERTFTFKMDGSALTGETTSSLLGKSAIVDGKVDGDNVTFTLNVKFNDTDMRLNYKGKVSPGGKEIKFTVEAGGQTIEWVAKKTS